MLDLVMWTFNSSQTLDLTLKSINRAVPRKFVNNRFIVDGGSKDNTVEIAAENGWDVVESKKSGISNQANLALECVSTDCFCSFEHDIILNPNWFSLIFPTLQKDRVAVSQGVRVCVNPVLKAIDNFSLKRDLRYSSIDNNIYRTDVIREIGGFPEAAASSDRYLQDEVLNSGFKWLVNKNIVSLHNKPSFLEELRHIHKFSMIKNYPESTGLSRNLKLFAFSFIRGLQVAKKEKQPLTVCCYPVLRASKLRTAIKVRGL